jgi:hypothetical protein
VWEIIKSAESVDHDLNNNVKSIPLKWAVERLTGLKYEEVEDHYKFGMFRPHGSNLTESEKKQKYFWVELKEVYPDESSGEDSYLRYTYFSRFEVADRLLKIIGDVDMLTKFITERD